MGKGDPYPALSFASLHAFPYEKENADPCVLGFVNYNTTNEMSVTVA